MLAVVGLLAGAPVASAHPDGCFIWEHTTPFKAHLVCFTSPNTCFANVQIEDAARVHVLCSEPENMPCAAKVMVSGNWVKECSGP